MSCYYRCMPNPHRQRPTGRRLDSVAEMSAVSWQLLDIDVQAQVRLQSHMQTLTMQSDHY